MTSQVNHPRGVMEYCANPQVDLPFIPRDLLPGECSKIEPAETATGPDKYLSTAEQALPHTVSFVVATTRA